MQSHALPNPDAPPHLAGLDTLAPEELRCPYCDYSVYGLPAPRCPECGQTFTWDQARDSSDANSDLFEHRWREQPVASLLRTWLRAAFCPWRLWNINNQRSRPRLPPLLFFLLLQAVLFAGGWRAMAFLIDPLMNYLGELTTSGRVDALGRSVPPTRFTYDFRMSTSFLENVAIWHLCTFAILLILREMPDRAAPTWRRVLRVYVHATALASLCMALWCVAEACVDAAYFFKPPGWQVSRAVYSYLGDATLWLCLLSTWACLWYGYRWHLRMPHGWAIAAVALFTGSLAPRILALIL
ncbi:MAG: hypothetical protein RBU21_20950 [FCB group bacterium]|nr:hypothetical protein [FCB group bacterium]